MIVRQHRRTPREWCIRLLLAAGAGWIGFASVTHSLAQVLSGKAVVQAYALAPWDGRFTAALAEKRLGSGADAVARGKAERLARLALRQVPTAVVAAATLGLAAQLRGNVTVARRWFAYSERLSRRNLRTQLWAIEDAVVRDDIPDVLRHYDIALRTSRRAPDLLLPVLAAATTDPAIRSALIRVLAEQPAWAEDFIAYVAGNGPDPRATATLFHGLQRAGVRVAEGPQATTINSLIAGGFFDAAWSYYASVRPGVTRWTSRDPGFTADLASPSLFDWVPVNDAGISTSIQRGDRGGVLDFAASFSAGGDLVKQMQMLPPGAYQLEGHRIDADQPEGSRPYWRLSCIDGRELGRIPLSSSARSDGRFGGRLDVPADCRVQSLALVAQSLDATGTRGQVDEVRLRPLR